MYPSYAWLLENSSVNYMADFISILNLTSYRTDCVAWTYYKLFEIFSYKQIFGWRLLTNIIHIKDNNLFFLLFYYLCIKWIINFYLFCIHKLFNVYYINVLYQMPAWKTTKKEERIFFTKCFSYRNNTFS